MRRAVPWIDLGLGIVLPAAGLVLLASGTATEGPLTFMGWRTLVLAVPGVLLARPSAIAWRDALPGGAVAVFTLGMLGNALAVGDVAPVAVVTIGIAFGAAPLLQAASCLRMPNAWEAVGAVLVAAGIGILGSTDGFPTALWLAAASGVGFAAVAVLTDRVVGDHSVPAIVTAQATIAAGALVVAGGLLEGSWLPGAGSVPLLAAAGLATGLAPLLARWRGAEVLGFLWARRALPAEVFVAVIAATWAGGPSPTVALWVAAGLAVAGSVVVAWQPSRLAETETFSLGR